MVGLTQHFFSNEDSIYKCVCACGIMCVYVCICACGIVLDWVCVREREREGEGVGALMCERAEKVVINYIQ